MHLLFRLYHSNEVAGWDGISIVKLITPRPSFTLTEDPLMQCEPLATKLNRWFRDVGVNQPDPLFMSHPVTMSSLGGV